MTGPVTGAAIIADGCGHFALDSIEVDAPAADEVRVELVAAGVCHTDYASLNWPGPLVMGHEGAGRVDAIGADVSGLAVGQPVLLNWAIPCGECFQCRHGNAALCERTHELDPTRIGTSRAHSGATRRRGQALARSFHLGTFANYTLVRAEAVTPLPTNLRLEEACILGCAVMTGVGSAVNVAAVAPLDTVAVIGCGGVGLNVIQGARIAGARMIIAIDRVPERARHAQAFGATHTILAQTDDVDHSKVIAAVRKLTDGRGVDHAFEATGVAALAWLPLRLARNGGNALQVSGAHGPATLDLTDLFWNKRYLAPLYGGCVPTRDFPRLFRWIDEGKLKLAPLVSQTYPLADLGRAFDDMLAGRGTKGVLRIA